jgi:actin related protein 2/3 complex subunit 2
MILLDFHNKIIEDTLLEKWAITDGKFDSVETIIADFDGVTFHIFTPDSNAKNLLQISMSMKCYSELKKYGVEDVLNKQYANFITSTENNYDVTLQIDCAQPPADGAKTARDISLLKRHALGAPFYKVFSDIEGKRAGNLVEIRYRDEEAFYIKPESDRAIVIFNIQFRDSDDIVFAKLFLQEYADARKTMNNAPSVTYSQKEPPLELKGVKNLKVGEGNGFVSFVLFAPHITGNKKEKTIDNIQTFRNYLHYHIKCSKAYMHTRMRNRVKTFLQVLNRAKSDVASNEKKTMTGRTFKRADDPQGEPSAADDEYNI